MMKQVLFSILCLATLGGNASFAQPVGSAAGHGALALTVSNADNDEPLPFVRITLYQNGESKFTCSTDFDGKAGLAYVPFGQYEIEFSAVGFEVMDSLDTVTILSSNKTFCVAILKEKAATSDRTGMAITHDPTIRPTILPDADHGCCGHVVYADKSALSRLDESRKGRRVARRAARKSLGK
jgi:hypothetical protein